MYKNQKTVLLLIVLLVILSVGYFSACKKSNPLTDEEVKTFRTSGYSSPSIETIDPVCTIGSTYEFTAQVPKGFNISKYNIDYFMLTTGATNLAIYTATSAIILIPLTSNWRTINTNPLYISANNDVYFISPSTAKSFIST